MAKRRKKANGALTKITTRAKTIYRNGGTWKAAIKKAGAEYRAGSLGGSRAVSKGKKKSKGRRKSRRISGTTGTNPLNVMRGIPGGYGNKVPGGARLQMVNGIRTGTVTRAKQLIKENCKQKLASALLRRDMAKGVRKKKKIGKQVSQYRAELKKYC